MLPFNLSSLFRHILRALDSRNLRIFFLGQGISLIGTWITTIASSWLAYRLTNSEAILGAVAFSSQFPTAIFGPFAGVYVDRCDKRKVLLCTQTLSMLQSFLLFYFTAYGSITVSLIIGLNLFQAIVNAFDTPARQSFLPEIVNNRRDLPNAVALGAAMFHGSRLIGPAIAGIIINKVGEASCFLIDGFSYAAVLYCLTLIAHRNITQTTSHGTWTKSMREGLHYAINSLPIRNVLFFVSLLALLGVMHTTLLPVFAKVVLGGGPDLYGYLMAASGMGAMFGSLYLASLHGPNDLFRAIAPMPCILGIMLLAFSYIQLLYLNLFLLFAAGFAMVTFFAGGNSIIQVTVEDSKRARVMSIFSACFFGMMPLGGLLAGYIASKIGAPLTTSISGIIDIGIGYVIYKRLTNLHQTRPA